MGVRRSGKDYNIEGVQTGTNVCGHLFCTMAHLTIAADEAGFSRTTHRVQISTSLTKGRRASEVTSNETVLLEQNPNLMKLNYILLLKIISSLKNVPTIKQSVQATLLVSGRLAFSADLVAT